MNPGLTPANSLNTGAPTGTTRTINWGGVLKGAAIVTAVVVAGVVGFYAFQALAGSAAVAGFFANPTVNGLAAGFVNLLSSAWDMLLTAGGWVSEQVVALWKAIPSTFGLPTLASPEVVTHIADATGKMGVQNVVATLGAGAATAVAAHAASPHLANVQLTTDVPTASHTDTLAASGLFAGHPATTAHTAHHLADAANHVAQHDHPENKPEARRPWTDRVPAKTASHIPQPRTGGFTDTFQPRDPNFATQLNTDRAALETALRP